MGINYTNSFMTVSADSGANSGTPPPRPGTVAALQYAMLSAAPYRHTSADVIFAAYAGRNLAEGADLPSERAAFFSRSQACLRASPLVKTYGWGLHHDDQGRVALVGMETSAYAEFAEREDLTIVLGMRNKRAK